MNEISSLVMVDIVIVGKDISRYSMSVVLVRCVMLL